MLFTLTDEQTLIQETARAFFAEHATSAAIRATIETDSAFDASLWTMVMAEMGFGGIALPESYGGSGLGQVELAIIMMEMGRNLYPSPYLSSVCMAASAILNSGSEAQKESLLPDIASGKRIAALAYMSVTGKQTPDATLSELEGGFRLHGSSGFVPYGHVADLFVIAARSPNGELHLLTLDASTPGLSVERHTTMDMTRPLSTLRFDNITINADQLLGSPEKATSALERTLDLARIALAAEQAGGAEAILDMTVNYSKDRIQFGRPIGSFQALKHRMADMMVETETAKTAAYYAACIADEGSDELAEAAAIARAYCSDAFSNCAGHGIQLHGGIGFTWEHDAQLYFKRARGSAVLLGDPATQREKVAQLIGLGEIV